MTNLRPEPRMQEIAVFDQAELEEMLDKSYKLSLDLKKYDPDDLAGRYAKLKDLLPKLPMIAKNIINKCRSALTAQEIPDPGLISVYLVGGRTEIKHIGPDTDFDLVITFQSVPWRENEAMSQKLHLASIEVNSAIDVYNSKGEHTIINCPGIGSTPDEFFRKAAYNKDTILLYSETKA